MAGHNKWKQIKDKKGVTDKRRGVTFGKLVNAISVAAKTEPNPNFNRRLKSAIEKAKSENVPQENIERAINRLKENGAELEEMKMEAYGPGGIAILIEAISDSKNRTIAEIKTILRDNNGKWAEPGSVLWAFKERENHGGWDANFPQETKEGDRIALEKLIETLEEDDDVQHVFTNIKL